ncbi:MAG: hypothetical protein ACWGQW_10900 [bacterium]
MRNGVFLLVLITVSASSCVVSLDGLGGEANFVDFSQSEPAGNEELMRARVELKVGQIEIEPGTPSNSYDLELHYNELAFDPMIEFAREDGVAHLAIGLDGEGKSFRGFGENKLFLRLSPNIPLDLETNNGIGECNLNLTGMKIRSLILESGVGETTLTMLEPNPISCETLQISSGVGELELVGLGNLSFEELDFQGGVGGASLDFSGSWDTIGEVEIKVGVGGISLLLPRDIGAEIRASKTFMSNIELPNFTKKGNTYYSDNLDRVSKVIKFRVTAGIGEVELEWI